MSLLRHCGHNGAKAGCAICAGIDAGRIDAEFSHRCAVKINALKTAVTVPLPCVHEGAVLEYATCGSHARHVRDCDRHERCTRGANKGSVASCRSCPDYSPVTTETPRAGTVPLPSRSFNGSIYRRGGRTLFASRRNQRLWLSELAADLTPAWTRPIPITHPLAADGQEDPRLFEHLGKLHVSFTGLKGKVPTVLFAKLGEGFRVVEEFAPRHKVCGPEKNWAFFEAGESLHYVYSIEPHVVARLSRDGHDAFEAGRTSAGLRWDYGHLRGGAPPVRVGDRFYHWFHGTRKTPSPFYTLGLYTFEAAPPFKILSWVPEPLLYPMEVPGEKPVVFPCGAVLEDGRWVVSYGANDRECRVIAFGASEVERRLVGV